MLKGCGRQFENGEVAKTWNHGGIPGKELEWHDWENAAPKPWRCGQPANAVNSMYNSTTYYCHECQIRLGLRW